jgi:pseurotin A synthetase (hybrid polyketide synthase/nonribosomal peptide synthetase)
LQSVGFSGVDSLEKDPEGDSPFVILSQALDDQVSFLRAPLDSTPPFTTRGTLLVIGGFSQEIKQFIEIIQSRLRCVWDGEVIVIRSLTDLNSRDFDQVEAVLSLTELDQSVLESLSRDTCQGLHQLLNKSKIVLWVTYGAGNQNPHQSGIGLVRAVQAESPEKVLQLLNLDKIDGNESLVAESFLRLIRGVWMRDDSSKRLWTVEPELSVQGRRLLIPRVLFDKKRNDRLNSLRRRLKARDPFEKQSGTLVLPIDPSGLFSPSKTYVLIGLSGHMGQSITRWMASMASLLGRHERQKRRALGG